MRPGFRRSVIYLLVLMLLPAVAVLTGGSAGARPVVAVLTGAPEPAIAAMIGQVQTASLMETVEMLSGERPALVGGERYTILSRSTLSGEPIQKATEFAYESLQAAGLAASYQEWAECSTASRNVIGEKRGSTQAGEIVLLAAHLDSIAYPPGPVMPGADDNASGSTAVLEAAGILAPYSFARTIRFVLFTGEEQNLCGSWAYADMVKANGDNIVAVLNLDMIAYDAENGPIARLHTRQPEKDGSVDDQAIAQVFATVVNSYGIDLQPIVTASGEGSSDHYSFWQHGYPAILAIEDTGGTVEDFNPNYHSPEDRAAAFNQAYFTNFVKAATGTTAVLAGYLPVAPATPTPKPSPTATRVPTPTPEHSLYLPQIRH